MARRVVNFYSVMLSLVCVCSFLVDVSAGYEFLLSDIVLSVCVAFSLMSRRVVNFYSLMSSSVCVPFLLMSRRVVNFYSVMSSLVWVPFFVDVSVGCEFLFSDVVLGVCLSSLMYRRLVNFCSATLSLVCWFLSSWCIGGLWISTQCRCP